MTSPDYRASYHFDLTNSRAARFIPALTGRRLPSHRVIDTEFFSTKSPLVGEGQHDMQAISGPNIRPTEIRRLRDGLERSIATGSRQTLTHAHKGPTNTRNSNGFASARDSHQSTMHRDAAIPLPAHRKVGDPHLEWKIDKWLAGISEDNDRKKEQALADKFANIESHPRKSSSHPISQPLVKANHTRGIQEKSLQQATDSSHLRPEIVRPIPTRAREQQQLVHSQQMPLKDLFAYNRRPNENEARSIGHFKLGDSSKSSKSRRRERSSERDAVVDLNSESEPSIGSPIETSGGKLKGYTTDEEVTNMSFDSGHRRIVTASRQQASPFSPESEDDGPIAYISSRESPDHHADRRHDISKLTTSVTDAPSVSEPSKKAKSLQGPIVVLNSPTSDGSIEHSQPLIPSGKSLSKSFLDPRPKPELSPGISDSSVGSDVYEKARKELHSILSGTLGDKSLEAPPQSNRKASDPINASPKMPAKRGFPGDPLTVYRPPLRPFGNDESDGEEGGEGTESKRLTDSLNKGKVTINRTLAKHRPTPLPSPAVPKRKPKKDGTEKKKHGRPSLFGTQTLDSHSTEVKGLSPDDMPERKQVHFATQPIWIGENTSDDSPMPSHAHPQRNTGLSKMIPTRIAQKLPTPFSSPTTASLAGSASSESTYSGYTESQFDSGQDSDEENANVAGGSKTGTK